MTGGGTGLIADDPTMWKVVLDYMVPATPIEGLDIISQSILSNSQYSQYLYWALKIKKGFSVVRN